MATATMQTDRSKTMNPALEIVARALAAGRLTINALDDGSGVVLDVEGEQLMTMNATGLVIMQSIAEGADELDAVVHGITAAFDVDAIRARRDIEAFLDRMAGVL